MPRISAFNNRCPHILPLTMPSAILLTVHYGRFEASPGWSSGSWARFRVFCFSRFTCICWRLAASSGFLLTLNGRIPCNSLATLRVQALGENAIRVRMSWGWEYHYGGTFEGVGWECHEGEDIIMGALLKGPVSFSPVIIMSMGPHEKNRWSFFLRTPGGLPSRVFRRIVVVIWR